MENALQVTRTNIEAITAYYAHRICANGFQLDQLVSEFNATLLTGSPTFIHYSELDSFALTAMWEDCDSLHSALSSQTISTSFSAECSLLKETMIDLSIALPEFLASVDNLINLTTEEAVPQLIKLADLQDFHAKTSRIRHLRELVWSSSIFPSHTPSASLGIDPKSLSNPIHNERIEKVSESPSHPEFRYREVSEPSSDPHPQGVFEKFQNLHPIPIPISISILKGVFEKFQNLHPIPIPIPILKGVFEKFQNLHPIPIPIL
ncbi:hypothetical protein HDU93_006349 [Gonapodya sp. JEL0774]|nr:hypothetical protein HDU93_006349 [Gonapodya sp. JEL0774]